MEAKKKTDAEIKSLLAEIETTCKELVEAEKTLNHKRDLLEGGKLTCEQATDFWLREIRPKCPRWYRLCNGRLEALTETCRKCEVPEMEWGMSLLLKIFYFRYRTADAAFYQQLRAEWNKRKSFSEGKKVGFDKGRLWGMMKVLSGIGKHDEVMKRAEKAEAELNKPYLKMNRADWEKEVIAVVKKTAEYGGAKGAIRQVIKEKLVIEGAKHFKTFGSDGESDPTFEALQQAFKRSREKPHVKPTKQRPRKTRPCDFADGVKVDLPKEKYRE